MRKTYWILAFGVVALALSVLPWPSERAQSQRRAAIDGAGVREAIEQLRQELADERAERKRALVELEGRLLDLAADVPVDLAVAVAETAETAEQGESLGEQPLQLPRLQPGNTDPRSKIAGDFEAEPVDSAWAQATERSLHGVLGAKLKTGELRSLTCRKTMCRLETVVSDPKDYWQFMGEAFKNPDTRFWPGDVYAPQPAEAPGTGEVTLVSYLVREGERMPSPF